MIKWGVWEEGGGGKVCDGFRTMFFSFYEGGWEKRGSMGMGGDVGRCDEGEWVCGGGKMSSENKVSYRRDAYVGREQMQRDNHISDSVHGGLFAYDGCLSTYFTLGMRYLQTHC